MASKLFVGGISWDTTEDSLKNFFSQAGTVVSATIITDKFTGRSRGFGFVEMASDEESKAAIEKLNGQVLDGKTIAVNLAKPLEPRSTGPGPFKSGGGGFRPDRANSRGRKSYH